MIKSEEIQSKICTVRGVQVILDSDLAQLYGVETKALNQAVKRNIERFPKEFSFQLTADEINNLKSQTVTSNATKNLKSQIATSRISILRSRLRNSAIPITDF